MPLPAPRFIVVENSHKNIMTNSEMDFMEIDNESNSSDLMLCKTEVEAQGSQGVQRSPAKPLNPISVCQKRLFRNRFNEMEEESSIDNFH